MLWEMLQWTDPAIPARSTWTMYAWPAQILHPYFNHTHRHTVVPHWWILGQSPHTETLQGVWGGATAQSSWTRSVWLSSAGRGWPEGAAWNWRPWAQRERYQHRWSSRQGGWNYHNKPATRAEQCHRDLWLWLIDFGTVRNEISRQSTKMLLKIHRKKKNVEAQTYLKLSQENTWLLSYF